jgi:hypothetical protein
MDRVFEYGIGAGMFVVSVALIYAMLKYFSNTYKHISEDFSKSIKNLDDKHRDERAAWHKMEDMRNERANHVVKQLDETIREIIRNGNA